MRCVPAVLGVVSPMMWGLIAGTADDVTVLAGVILFVPAINPVANVSRILVEIVLITMILLVQLMVIRGFAIAVH